MTNSDLLSKLLKGKAPADFSAYDLGSKAYFRSSRDQHLEAAVLFEAAARRAQQEFDQGVAQKLNESGIRINQALNSWARAGFNYYRAGQKAQALELLTRCVHADWLGAGLNHDLNTVAMCWAYLVREQSMLGRKAFEAAFREAERRSEAICVGFPWSHPTRKELASLARGFGNEELAREIVAPLRTSKPMKRELKSWLKAFDASASAIGLTGSP